MSKASHRGASRGANALGPEPARLGEKQAAAPERPYVTLKAAATLDGKIATRAGASKWITGPAARAHGHRLRAGHDAVLVGMGTVLADDPRLTVRSGDGEHAPADARQPARIVLDSTARIDPAARMLADDGAARIVVCGARAAQHRLNALRRRGVTVLQCAGERPHASEFLPMLRRAGLGAILVEGGGEVHAHLIAEREADALFLYLAGRVMGDRDAPGWCGTLGGWTPAAGQPGWNLDDAPRVEFAPPQVLGGDILLHGWFTGTRAAASHDPGRTGRGRGTD